MDKAPQPVVVANTDPLPVEVVATAPVVKPLATADNPPARATTTSEDDLRTAGQRHVNLIWESTQRQISLLVVGTSMFVGMLVTVANVAGWGGGDHQIPTIFSVAFGTVIGFYFARTNHTKIGGVGGTDSR